MKTPPFLNNSCKWTQIQTIANAWNAQSTLPSLPGSQTSEVPGPSSIHEIISWLEEKPCFIEQVLLNKRTISALEIQSTSKILLKLADELVVLRPDNISNRSYDIHMRQWRVYWNDLLSELKTVATRTTCSGAFVLTDWPYPEFLTTLALTLCEKIVWSTCTLHCWEKYFGVNIKSTA